MYRRAVLHLGLMGFLGLAFYPGAVAQAERKAVAKCVSESGTILRRQAVGQPWVADKEPLFTSDLLLAGTDAALTADNGAVKLLLVGDAGGTAPLPIIETAVVLNASADVDFDFTLLRGRVDIFNQKAKGEAKVRVRGPKELRSRSGCWSRAPGWRCSSTDAGRPASPSARTPARSTSRRKP